MSAGITETIVEWESKWFSNEKIKPPVTANHSLSGKPIWMNDSSIRIILEAA